MKTKEEIREYHRQWYHKNKEKVKKKVKENAKKKGWYKHSRDKKKVRARWMARNLFKAGKIDRDKCYFCECRDNLIFHHEDYDKPEEVVCLCKKCHWKLHRIK